MKIVLSTQTFIAMMGLSVVFSGCVDPYYTPTHHYQSSSPTTRYYSAPTPRYVSPAPVYVAPTPRYVAPSPVYVPQQPQTKVIIVEQPHYRDSGRMDYRHPYDNDHGGSYRNDSDRMNNRSGDTYRNNSSRMDLQPNRSGDTYRNGSNRIDNRSNPAQNGSGRIDNRPTFQPTQPVQPVVQPRIDTHPIVQPTQPRMDNHPRRDSNSSSH